MITTARVLATHAPQSDTQDAAALRRRNAELEASLRRVTEERDKLRRAYEQLKEQYELLRRRLFIAKAERVDVRQLEIEFAATKAALDRIAQQLGEPEPESTPSGDTGAQINAGGGGQTPAPERAKPKGRRNLADVDLPDERVEIVDPALEGKAERIGFEVSYKLGYRPGGPVRIVLARAKYKQVESEGGATLSVAEVPREIVRRGLLAPGLIAHILVAKYRFGLPFTRQATMLGSVGLDVDDGTMCRYGEEVGAALGAIVLACAAEAKAKAFCLATDATGVSIQPARLPGGGRQSCAKGHFFVVLADRDHVFFEYQPKHTSAAVCEMFRGFGGYILADAHCIYDALFRGDARASPDDKPPLEVACWAHARRKFWEAAVATRDPRALEGLLRIHALFEREQRWASLAPQQRHAKRQLASRPLVDDFFRWATEQFAPLQATRGLLASAFGYALRQKDALRRFLDDGRLPLTNNASERALRILAVGRKAWLFFGSDDHAQAAANVLSLIASCALHGLDPEAYLTDVIRVLPYWPRDRFLELAPKYWAATRARLREDELALPLGHITVPPPLAAQEQTSSR